ncbi:RNA polymerase sigma-70 factor [Prolixibacteraceae bacterium JC049]|nr:RNA polymerase sigma-70 factor [Prolixibacteraceae bacterium JC049]
MEKLLHLKREECCMRLDHKITFVGNEVEDRKVFKSIYYEYFDMLFHLCLKYIGDEAVSEEIVQDSFMKLWEGRQKLAADTHIRNILYTITKNSCLNFLRNQQTALKNRQNIHYLEMQFNYEALNRLGNANMEFDELKQQIDNAIASLPEDIREVFLMSRLEEMKYREIADKLGVSVKTVEAKMSKALSLLRNDLKDYLHIVIAISAGLN